MHAYSIHENFLLCYNEGMRNDQIFQALFEIVTFFNQPEQDKRLLRRAGVSLDAALFPVFMRVGLNPSTRVGTLAEQLSLSHSTVSRQLDKLEAAGLIVSHASGMDGRVRFIQLSPQGKRLIATIAKARQAAIDDVLADWDAAARANLQRTLQRLASDLTRRSHEKEGL